MENIAPNLLPSWYASRETYASAGLKGRDVPIKPPLEVLQQYGRRGQESRAVLGDIDANALRAPSHVSQLQTQTLHNLVREPAHQEHQAEKKSRNWIDIDKRNKNDLPACSDYADVIFRHMKETELSRRANPDYATSFQTEINPKMRAILVDWLVEVAEEYKLCADTLYQAVNYLDRFLSIQVIKRRNLQLVGVACMWIAAKYEEIYPPTVSDFVQITDNTYTKEQIVAMEEVVLKKLCYELTVPTQKLFMRRLLQAAVPDELLHYMTNYLGEITLLDHNMLNFLPSEIAASTLYVANLLLRREPWNGTLQHYSGYEPRDIAPCATALISLHAHVFNSPQLKAINCKFGHQKFHAVSSVLPLVSNPTF